MTDLEADLVAVVAGDIARLSTVLATSHDELQHAVSDQHPPTISRAALIRVLHDWRIGTHGADEVQKWASFVRRGYVAGRAEGPIRPISIEYDAHDEDLIVEVIGRLDEIGDPIASHVSEDERDEMLRFLAVQAPKPGRATP